MCLHPKLKKTGEVITGRFEKRGVEEKKEGEKPGMEAPYYCDGDEAVCECGAVFIIPFGPGLRTVEIEKEPAKIKN
jgi:hypothetical protein